MKRKDIYIFSYSSLDNSYDIVSIGEDGIRDVFNKLVDMGVVPFSENGIEDIEVDLVTMRINYKTRPLPDCEQEEDSLYIYKKQTL